MTIKIGDKVRIADRSFSVEMRNNRYYNNSRGRGSVDTQGTVLAIDCRLPFAPAFEEHGTCPMDGLKLLGGNRLYNDLLIQVGGGFIFTSSDCIEQVPVKPKKYFVCVLGVSIEVTKDQYESVKESENRKSDNYFTGTFDGGGWG